MKDPDITLEKILKGLTKTMAQLESHTDSTNQLIASQEAAIRTLEARKAKAEAVRERTIQVSANLKELLAVPE